ncbi:MAG TPA: hypothetical protein VJ397_06370, partial [Thermoplasmata archaeon]|nr:hypothetical protein [Thermoplasmata archaeon]
GLLFLAGGVPIVDFSLLPSVNIVLNVGAVVADFFWNDKVDEELMKDIPLPFFFLPNPCPITLWTVTVEVNTVRDYVDQNPVHLFPSTGASLLDDSSTFSYSPPNPVIPCAPPEMIGANIVLDVPGFHRFPDHPSLFP